jgi:hypothetical protein
LFLAALNTDPNEASARLAGAIVRETLMAGGRACRPLIAKDGLGAAFIDPALRYLESRGVVVRFGHRLRAISFADARATALDFGEDTIALAPGDAVILAVPPTVASSVVPNLTAPTQFRAIVNAHFHLAVPQDTPMMTGLINSISHWLFAFDDRLSVTVSSADHLLDTPRETLAHDIWREVAAATGFPETLPAWQIVRERRATFAALPDEDHKRPAARTRWGNLILAGDWTATGLPATIEGAIRSGNKAADSLEDAIQR